MQKDKRLDLLVVELGLLPSRQAANAAIIDGGILVNGKTITKPGTSISENAKIEITPGWGPPKYVSRGGLKLEKALQEFIIDPKNLTCLDIGASTGGFTDCLLQHSAQKIYAVDVGYGQLDWKLRQDKRVVVKERINARFLKPEMLYEQNDPWAQLAVMDVSFISILKILPACLSVLNPKNFQIISLIKPQFEAGKEFVSKGGVVRSAAIHIKVLTDILTQAHTLGLNLHHLTFSPIKGPAGNIEYLVHLKPKTDDISSNLELIIAEIVDQAFKTLNN